MRYKMKVDKLASLLVALLVVAAPIIAYATTENTAKGKYTGAYAMASISGQGHGPNNCNYCDYGEWKSMIWDLKDGIDLEYIALDWWHAYFDGCTGKWTMVTGGLKVVYDPGEPGPWGNTNAIEYSSYYGQGGHYMAAAESHTIAYYTDDKPDAVADAIEMCGGAT